MEWEKPGFGFRPYDEELVGYYLRHKILGNHSLVDGFINVIDIYSVDPWNLHFQSRYPVLYFFSRRENKYANGNQQSRTTPSGFWKLTGNPVIVNDRWGHLSGSRGKMIGQKRVLTFFKGKNNSISQKPKTKSDWVMHELHYTVLPEDERTYVVCRLEYKGDDVNILSPKATDFTPTFVPDMANSASSVVDQSFQVNSEHYNSFPDHQFSGILESFQGFYDNCNHIWDYVLPSQSNWSTDNLNEPPTQVPDSSAPFGDDWDTQMFEQHSVRQDASRHRPKRPVTGLLPGDSSDSDTDSMIGTDAWSSTDSVGSKDGPCHSPKDDTPSLITIEPLHNHEAQEQPKQRELQLQGKEKKSECEREMDEDSIKKAPSTTAVKQSWIVLEEMSRRNSRWVHLNNMLFGLLLFISIIVWIMLAGVR